MLAARGLVWVAKDRAAGAEAAVAGGAKMVLLDDGYQNPGLRKDASILMIDAGAAFGNGRLIPAGPLREPVAEGLARADLAVLVGTEAEQAATLKQWPELQTLAHVGARMVPVSTGLSLEGQDVVAFAGIARPGKFFATLRGLGANLVATHGFPDHHPYEPAIVRRLLADAAQAGAMLITTEKDAVRLPTSLRSSVMMMQVALELDDWAPVDAILSRLTGASPEAGASSA